MSRSPHGGGWAAIKYTLDMADRVGWLRLWKAMRSKNACKTCALGMGGQLGGMRNEAGHWPEVCKKSLQAMAADMQDGVRPEFFQRYGFAELRQFTSRELEASGRLVTPLCAAPGDTHYRPIDWNDALDRIAIKLKKTLPEQSFFYMSGRSSNEAAFLLQLFARVYGTNHVNNCSYYCHQASGVGLTQALGVGTATVTLDDVENCDLFFLIGGNPASNHPRLMRTLMTIRRRGGQVVAINPIREHGLVNFRVPSDWRSLLFGSQIAGEYVQPHIGGDIALLTGIAKCLIEQNHLDHAYIQSATEGWPEFLRGVDQTAWTEIVSASGVERKQIEHIARLYAASKNAVFAWTMGITHHLHGVDNVRMIVNLALMRGMVGRKNAGLLPIRGHSNVQGIGSMGVTPQLKQVIFDRLESVYCVRLPTFRGHDTLSCIEAAARGEMRIGVCLGGNLHGANPDAAFVESAIGRLDTVVYLNTSLNTSHARARAAETIILPVLARDEEPQATTQESMFNYVRLSDGGEARHAGPRSEVAIIAQLARLTLGGNGPIDWRDLETHSTLRRWIANTVPGYEQIAQIDGTGKEFHVAGRVFHAPTFPTPTGRARFVQVSLPNDPAPALRHSFDTTLNPAALPTNTLRLMTIRSEGQFNTVVYEEEDLYRGQDRRDIILMNAADIEQLGLTQDALVTVRSAAGELQGIHVRPFDIRAGNAAMYYPEANALVPRDADPQSRTPAFKNVLITVAPQSIAHPQPDGRVHLHLAETRASRKLNAC